MPNPLFPRPRQKSAPRPDCGVASARRGELHVSGLHVQPDLNGCRMIDLTVLRGFAKSISCLESDRR